MLRTHTCGQLRPEDVGKKVSLCGFVDAVRDLGALVFVDLRDRYGITQLNIEPSYFKTLSLRPEWVVRADGEVVLRSDPNDRIPTGRIEIRVEKVTVYSKAETTPFPIQDEVTASEDTRLQYRYLDLRRPKMLRFLETRALISRYTREFLVEEGFLEVDTPTLIKSTPEGARDYLVPSRIFPGSFYALPQSPQLYKQLLMISGVDRYFQLAHCYRDEDQRADRQPEFMQIDCEMSFVEREDVLDIIERLLKHLFLKIKNVVLPDFERLSYRTCIDDYGTDKPDLRFDMKIRDVTNALENCGFKAFEGKRVKALVVNRMATATTRKKMDEDNLHAKKFKVFGVSHLKFNDGHLSGGISKNMTAESLADLAKVLELQEDDLVILCADASGDKAAIALGALRTAYGSQLGLTRKDVYRPLFVIDWPLFEREEDGHIECLSNPFTRPVDEDLPLFGSDPTKIRSTSYDTVLNGVELSSGALRIHDAEIQKKVFELLGLSEADIENRFGFLVKALKYGVPPEGGFGIGIERLAMELCETDNVRDVVAFPKNLRAVEPMSQCPSPVPKEDLDVLGIEIQDGKNGQEE